MIDVLHVILSWWGHAGCHVRAAVGPGIPISIGQGLCGSLLLSQVMPKYVIGIHVSVASSCVPLVGSCAVAV